MEFKTLVAVLLILIGFAVLVALIFFFTNDVSGSNLNTITSWNWIK